MPEDAAATAFEDEEKSGEREDAEENQGPVEGNRQDGGVAVGAGKDRAIGGGLFHCYRSLETDSRDSPKLQRLDDSELAALEVDDSVAGTLDEFNFTFNKTDYMGSFRGIFVAVEIDAASAAEDPENCGCHAKQE